jgi:hypothetical protein
VYLLSVPTAPQNLRIMGFTITQLKIGWDMPEQINGTMKGYRLQNELMKSWDRNDTFPFF